MGQTVSNVSFNNSCQKDSLDVFCEYAGEKDSSFVKAFYVFVDFFELVGAIPSETPLSTLSEHAKTLKIAHGPMSFLKAVNTLRNSTVCWLEGNAKTSLSKLWRQTLDLVNPVVETTMLVGRVAFVPSGPLAALKGLNGAALFLAQGSDALDSLSVLGTRKGEKPSGGAKPYTQFQYDEKFIKLVYQVSYVALGVMTVLSTFFSVVFAPLTYSLLSVTTVVFGFIDYYHKHILEEKDLTLRG